MTRDDLGEEEVESRWEAAPAVALVIGIQVALGFVSREKGWDLWGLPWWVWLVAVVPRDRARSCCSPGAGRACGSSRSATGATSR